MSKLILMFATETLHLRNLIFFNPSLRTRFFFREAIYAVIMIPNTCVDQLNLQELFLFSTH